MLNKDRLIYCASLIFCLIGGGVLLYILIRYVFISLLPFLIAWGIAFAVRRPSFWLHRKTRIPVRIISAVLAALGALLIIAAGFGVIWKLAALLWEFISELDSGEVGAFIDKISSFRFGIFGNIIPEELTDEVTSALKSSLGSLLSSLAEGITRWVGTVPRAVVFVVISFIATIYFALDLEGVNRGVRNILPEKIYTAAVRVKNGFLSVGLKYIKAYSVIMSITFVLMLTGLSVLRVNNALIIALIIAVLDILPVLGVGFVLVPWSIFSLFTGNTFLGVGLLILLAVNEITRQICEPKIIGKNLNLHPILTLALLYSGYALFGILGLILLPVFAVFIAVIKDKSA